MKRSKKMIIEGEGKYLVTNNRNQIFYFRTQKECAKFLGVSLNVIREAIKFGNEIRGYFVDLTIDD